VGLIGPDSAASVSENLKRRVLPMSQFAMMIAPQGSTTTLKASAGNTAETLQTAATGDVEAPSFAETLQSLSESNPNAAALLLALQQAGLVSDQPLSLSLGGTALPPATKSGGNPLPLPQLQSLQTKVQLPIAAEVLQSIDPRQLQQLLGDKALPETMQTLTKLVQSGLAAEGMPQPESASLSDFGAQLQGLGVTLQQTHAAAVQRPTIVLPVQVPVGQPGWDNAVGERIQWMVSKNVQQAEIKLTPPNLGPMEIKISMQNDQTHVHFIANHSATREALEAAIPRLREMFGEINLNLANVDVNQRQPGGASSQDGSAGYGSGSDGRYAGEGFGLSRESGSSVLRLQSEGLLDTYA
jgi:flagellar hook-length control protein FliK